MRRIGTAERRARLGRRHHLSPGAAAASMTAVAGDLVGLHSTDPATVYLSAAARCPTLDPTAISAALYDERSVVRLLGMRRTVWVVPVVKFFCPSAALLCVPSRPLGAGFGMGTPG